MTKVVNSSEYSENLISVGVALNEDGEPLLESNGVAVGTVKYLLERIVEYRDGRSASANIEGADKDAVARLQRELDDLKTSLAKRVEEAIKSAAARNVRHHL